MRRLFFAFVLVVMLVSLVFPAVALADGVSPPGGDTLFGLDLVTAALLIGATVAVSDFLKDLIGIPDDSSRRTKTMKLGVVLVVGFALVALYRQAPDSWVMSAIMVPVSAAGYYKMFGAKPSPPALE